MWGWEEMGLSAMGLLHNAGRSLRPKTFQMRTEREAQQGDGWQRADKQRVGGGEGEGVGGKEWAGEWMGGSGWGRVSGGGGVGGKEWGSGWGRVSGNRWWGVGGRE